MDFSFLFEGLDGLGDVLALDAELLGARTCKHVEAGQVIARVLHTRSTP